MDEPKLNRFAVIGNPINHSMSPYIHQSFANQQGVELSYEKILCEKTDFEETVRQFFAEGGCGLNITTPFKSDAAQLVDSCSEIASASQSVNTIYADQQTGKLIGTSTDGKGWLSDIQRLQIDLKNSRVLVIGAGGAARILVNQLLLEATDCIHVANRTLANAQHLANEKVTASDLNEVPDKPWDLIINTLSVGWQGSFPEINVKPHSRSKAYDLNYGKGALPFHKWFVDAGGEDSFFYGGWGMLVEQAAASFHLWWHKKPDTTELIKAGHL